MDPKRILVPVNSVKRIIDRTAPASPGSVYRASPEDIMLAAARMQRDGMSREAIMERLEVGLSTGVDNATMDRFLERARQLLDQRIAQGLEPAESQITVEIPVAIDPGPQAMPGNRDAVLYEPGEDDEPGEPA